MNTHQIIAGINAERIVDQTLYHLLSKFIAIGSQSDSRWHRFS